MKHEHACMAVQTRESGNTSHTIARAHAYKRKQVSARRRTFGEAWLPRVNGDTTPYPAALASCI